MVENLSRSGSNSRGRNRVLSVSRESWKSNIFKVGRIGKGMKRKGVVGGVCERVQTVRESVSQVEVVLQTQGGESFLITRLANL